MVSIHMLGGGALIGKESERRVRDSLVPSPPQFLFFGLRSVLSGEKRGRPGNTVLVMWTIGGCRGVVPDYKYMCIKPGSEFLTRQVEYLRSCERLRSCLLDDEVQYVMGE